MQSTVYRSYRLVGKLGLFFSLLVINFIGCAQSDTPRQVAELPLRLHLTPFSRSWIDEGRFEMTMFSSNGKKVSLPSSQWLIQETGEEPYLVATIELSGPWRAPLRFLINLRTKSGETHSWSTELESHPLLDHRRRSLWITEETNLSQGLQRLNIKLQPLSFLSDQIDWAHAVGLNSELWWDREEEISTEDSGVDLKRILLEAWASSQGDFSEQDHQDPEHIERLWTSLNTALEDQSWGETFSSTLEKLYQGRVLDHRLAALLIHSFCAPFKLSITSPSQDMSSVPTSERSKAELETCQRSQRGRIYFERPSLSILTGSLRSISARAFALSDSKIIDMNLHKVEINGDKSPLSLNDESSEKSIWSFEDKSLSMVTVTSEIDWRLLNRPSLKLETSCTNEEGQEHSMIWPISLNTPITSTLFTFASLIKPFTTGKVIALPLTDRMSAQELNQEVKGLWSADIDNRGEAMIEISGYYGPLWVTAIEKSHDEQENSDLVLSTLIELPPSPPSSREESSTHGNEIDSAHIGVWLSPNSSFATWLFEQLLPRGDQETIVSMITQEINLAHRSLFALALSQRLSSSDLTTPSQQAELWHQQITEAHARWSLCAQGLMTRFRVDEEAITRIAELGEELSLSTLFDRTREDSLEGIIEKLIDAWLTQMAIACLSAELEESSDYSQTGLLSILRTLAANRLGHQDLTASRSLTSFDTTLELKSGVWSREYLSNSWYVSHGSEFKISLNAARGLHTVALNLSKPLEEDQSELNLDTLPVELVAIDLARTESSSPSSLCLWSPPLSLDLLIETPLDDDRTWHLLTETERIMLFESPRFMADYTLAWGWRSDDSRVQDSLQRSHHAPAPLPCEINLEGQNLSLESGQYHMNLAAELWGSDEEGALEIEQQKLRMVVDQSVPLLTVHLDEQSHPSERSPWLDLTVDPLLPRWVKSSPPNIMERESLFVTLKTDRPTRCRPFSDLDTALEPTQLGEISIEVNFPSDPLDIHRSLQGVDLFSNLKELSPYKVFERYARTEGGPLSIDPFVGSWAYGIEITPQAEGNSTLYLRCEDTLGRSTVSRLLFTVDSEAPQILSATLSGINEMRIRDSEGRPKLGILAHELEREVDLLELEGSAIKWGRWITHWMSCPEQCPSPILSSLILKVIATDEVTLNQELHASIVGSLYLLDEREEARVLERALNLDLGKLDERGELNLNLYDLLTKRDFTGFPPADGEELHLELLLMITDIAGHQSMLPFHVELSPIAPMVKLHFTPPTLSLSQVVESGALDQVFGVSLGRLEIENPHPTPLMVSFPLPMSMIELGMSTRESGLSVESNRLEESCLVNESNRFDPSLRLVDYSLSGSNSIVGRCVPLAEPPPTEQELIFSSHEWPRGNHLLFNGLQLDPYETVEIELPLFSPPLSADLIALIHSPDIPPTPSEPSPFQRRLFNETSIFQRTNQCEQCTPAFIAGNRVASLSHWNHHFQASDESISIFRELEQVFDIPPLSPAWFVNVRALNERSHNHLMGAPINLDGAYQVE